MAAELRGGTSLALGLKARAKFLACSKEEPGSRLKARRDYFLERLKAGSSSNFSAFINEKPQFKVDSRDILTGMGSSGLKKLGSFHL